MLAHVELQGTICLDWEDIAINKEEGISYIYLADIGDNFYLRWFFSSSEVSRSFFVRPSLTIYKFKEPSVSQDWNGHYIMIGSQDIEHIQVKYPDDAHDCEALAVDPLNGDILLFTKNHQHNESRVYTVPHGWDNPRILEYVTTLPLMLVTGADISPSGDTLALTNYGEGWSWSKSDRLTSWVDFLRTGPSPCTLPLKTEMQREAIAVTERWSFF